MASKKKTKYSYTRIEAYENCPFAYFLKYIQGNYLFTPTAATTFGTLVHKILEIEANSIKDGEEIQYNELINLFKSTNCIKMIDDKIISIDEIEKKFPDEWANEKTKSGKSYAQKAEDFIEKGIYRLPKYMDEHPDYELVGCEIPFEFEYNGYLFTGYIDRLLRVKGTKHFIIHDIKTKDSLFTDTATCLQFVIYSMALQQIYGEDATFECVYDLPVLDTYQSVCTKGYIERGKKKLDKLFSKIEKRDWTPHSSPLCWWCAFRLDGAVANENCKQLCSYYSLWTPDKKSFETRLPWLGIENDWKQLRKLKEIEELKNIDVNQIEI